MRLHSSLCLLLFALTALPCEAQGNNTPGGASSLGAVPTTASASINPAGDEDWWVMTMPYTGPVDIDLLVTGGDLDLELYDQTAANFIAGSYNWFTSNENLNVTLTARTYYIRVFGAYSSTTGNYTLETSTPWISAATVEAVSLLPMGFTPGQTTTLTLEVLSPTTGLIDVSVTSPIGWQAVGGQTGVAIAGTPTSFQFSITPLPGTHGPFELTFKLQDESSVLDQATRHFVCDYPTVTDADVAGAFVDAEGQAIYTVADVVDSYRPVIKFSSYNGDDDPWRPTDVSVMIQNSELRDDGGWGSSLVLPLGSVTTTALAQSATDDFYLDLVNTTNNQGNPGCTSASNALGAVGSPRMYAVLWKEGNELTIQYWFFMAYNNWLNTHEGDWECCTIRFVFDGASGLFEPQDVATSAHYGHNRRHWDRTPKWFDPSLGARLNPMVFMGRGGHASYLFPGTTCNNFTCPVAGDDWHPGDDTWWLPTGYGTSYTDTLQVPPASVTILPRGDDAGSSQWLLFSGRWGSDCASVGGVSLGTDGPRGPMFRAGSLSTSGTPPWSSDMWVTPGSWMNNIATESMNWDAACSDETLSNPLTVQKTAAAVAVVGTPFGITVNPTGLTRNNALLGSMGALRYSYDWGDGSPIEHFTNVSSGATHSHTYTSVGAATIRVWVIERHAHRTLQSTALLATGGEWYARGSISHVIGINPPQPGSPLAGSGEDYILEMFINGNAPPPGGVAMIAYPGDAGQASLSSPGGGFQNSIPILAAQLFYNNQTPYTPPAFPSIHIDPNNAVILPVSTPLPSTFSFTIPPGLYGQRIRFQSVALQPTAANMIFAVTDAFDVIPM